MQNLPNLTFLKLSQHNEYCHHGLFDFGVALSPDMPHVVDVELVGVAVSDGSIFLELYLVEHVIVGLKQVYSVCNLLYGVGAVWLGCVRSRVGS